MSTSQDTRMTERPSSLSVSRSRTTHRAHRGGLSGTVVREIRAARQLSRSIKKEAFTSPAGPLIRAVRRSTGQSSMIPAATCAGLRYTGDIVRRMLPERSRSEERRVGKESGGGEGVEDRK